MQTNAYNVWWPRGVTFGLAALAAFSATYWVLKVSAAGSAAMAPAASSGLSLVIDTQAVARSFGGGKVSVAAAPVPVNVAGRFVMAGVLADQRNGGAALIAVDGKPPKPYAVGSAVDDGLVLQSVQGRVAVLAPSMSAPASVTLELPPLKR